MKNADDKLIKYSKIKLTNFYGVNKNIDNDIDNVTANIIAIILGFYSNEFYTFVK